MGARTGIEWTDATWNPIRGCTRVSEGCRNCYAESVAYRFSGPGLPYEGLAVLKNGHASWTGKVEFVEKHLLDPLKWGPVLTGIHDGDGALTSKRRRDGIVTVTRPRSRRIFVNSMSDLFHENVTDEMRDKIFAVMALCPQHTFQVLTKRPARMLEYFKGLLCGRISFEAARIIEANWPRLRAMPEGFRWSVEEPFVCRVSGGVGEYWPLRNVWLGVSVEDQKTADDRLDYLCEIASRGWQTMVSFEPLLGAVDPGSWWLSLGARTWAIVGGESGPAARPMHPEWARGLRDQCAAAGVPFFFKQWGEWGPDFTSQPIQMRIDREGRDVTNLPGLWGQFDAPLRRVGKHAAGALLDGHEWKQFPAVSA